MKEISVGRESFAKFIENDNYYIDKTLFIKEVFKKDQSDVLLITRPRRFGKTLTMSTFYEFLRINPSNPENSEDTSYQQKLFKDTQIYQDQEFCQEFMGKFPVIFVTFKNVYGGDFKSAYEMLASTIYDLAANYNYLLENKNCKLTESQLTQLRKFFDKEFLINVNNSTYIKDSLTTLTWLLYTYHGVKPILLIDEYDVPIAKAAAIGYYDDMINIISTMLTKVLKTNQYLGKAVLTGCLRAAKESIFTGLNNLNVCSILETGTPKISRGIGFTKEETEQVLSYYKLDKYFDLVTENYDGYRFGREQMYCPWDVMNFCGKNYQNVGEYEKYIAAGNYWINSSGNNVIEEYMGYIKPEHIDQMQALVDGGTITSVVREALCYGDLKNHNIEDFWTLLLYTGYLTINPEYIPTKRNEYELRIPNLEVRECFKEKIQDFFSENPLMQNYTTELVKGLFNGDAETVEQNINNLLAKYVSIRDLAASAPKENFYQGLMIGALANASVEIDEMQSNMESGDGYADLKLSARDGNMVVIELKQNSDKKTSRTISAEKAIKQIIDKRYVASEIENPDIKKIYAFGICFYRKECSVVTKQLK